MPPSLIVHGGAGALADPEDGQAHADGCAAAARAGFEILRRGGSALDAALAVVVCLEDDPLFNAGLGSALTLEGEVECDASVMSGDGRAGAVGCLREVKNPIRAAQLVMERTAHVLIVGTGAEDLAREGGLARVAAGALVTERARERWRAALERRAPAPGGGTVGCVARDAAGQLAAATSTGGVVLKRRGRVGDSAVIGAGTYADDRAGAVSCTGLGEAFIKAGAAKQVVDALRAGRPGPAAAREALDLVRRHGGEGGLIWVDRAGLVGAVFDTPHMSHAWVGSDGRVQSNYKAPQVELS